MRMRARADRRRIVFAGDSMSGFGSGLPGGISPSGHIAAFYPSIPLVDEAVGGTAASHVYMTRGYLTRWGPTAAVTIGVIVTGTNSYALGISGASVYSSIQNTAAAMLTAGFDYVYATTCVPSSEISAGAEDDARLAGNALLLAPAALVGGGGSLAGIAGWAAESTLQVPGYDGTHFNLAQRLKAAEIIDAAIAPALAA